MFNSTVSNLLTKFVISYIRVQVMNPACVGDSHTCRDWQVIKLQRQLPR